MAGWRPAKSRIAMSLRRIPKYLCCRNPQLLYSFQPCLIVNIFVDQLYIIGACLYQISVGYCWRYVCMLTTECRQWCSPVGTVSICLPAHLQHRDILISCSLLHLSFTCWDLYKSPPRRTRQTQFATTLSL